MFYYDKESVYSTPYEAWQSGKECKLYYYDHVFDNVDWKAEPSQSLDELYVERAKKLRDEYEYIILCYSGGNDSSNVLETFYYNNIHIDEIVIVGSFSQDVADESLDENHNSDLYLNAFPLLKTLNLPNTKITVIDYTKLFHDIDQFSLIQKYDTNWIQYIGTHKSPHNLFWSDFRKFVGVNNNKKTAWIMGVEKVNVDYPIKKTIGPFVPYSTLEYDKPFVYFNDATINNYGMNYTDENFTRVNFYCDPDETAVKIQIKQAHIFHRLITLSNKEMKKRVITNRVMLKNRLFYSPKHPLSFQSQKSKTSFLSARDMFLFNNQSSDIYQYYMSTLKQQPKYVRTEGGRNFYTKNYHIT